MKDEIKKQLDTKGMDPELLAWLEDMKEKKAAGSPEFYDSCQKLAEEAGFPNMFDKPRK